MADIAELKTMMKVMMQGINELKAGQQKYEEEMRVMRSENADLKAKLNELGSRLEMLEKEKIWNNLVIRGFELNTDDSDITKKQAENFMKEKLGVETKIKSNQGWILGGTTRGKGPSRSWNKVI